MAWSSWDVRPKIVQLAWALDEHEDELEASLQSVYQERLDDYLAGRDTWRRLWVLMRHLPPTSSFAQAVSDGDSVWGVTEHLLAGQLDALHAANWQRGGKSSAPRPPPTPRPGVERRETQTGSSGRALSTVALSQQLYGVDDIRGEREAG